MVSPKQLCFHYEDRDAPAISIKFEVHDEMREEAVHAVLLGSIEVNLESLINAGSSGLELPIFSLIEPYKQKGGGNRIEPGRIFLRSELLKQIDYAVSSMYSIKIQSIK